jgi:hypothetical protein
LQLAGGVVKKYPRRIAFIVIPSLMLFALEGRPTYGDKPDVDPKLPLLGTWIFNAAKSSFNRGDHPGNSLNPPKQAKWSFEIEKGGIRQKIYERPESAAPLVSSFYRFDGREYPDPHGPGKGEVVLPWLVNRYTQIRHVYTTEKTTEWSVYAVSADGNTLTVTAWNDRAWARNFQVFDKQQ